MSYQYSVDLRNAQLEQIETVLGASPRLRLFSGAMPANVAAAATGLLLVDMALPSDWMAAAVNGSKAMLGTWAGVGTASAGSGTVAGYFRIVNSAGTVTHIQGTVTITGGGGAMTIDNPNIANSQNVSVTGFTVTAGNA